ncbi:MAG: enoyl-CoA hydratase/isomerase family protein [Methyloligellaceae bacterium]
MSEQDAGSHVKVEKVDRCGFVTLSRPEAFNALTLDMVEQIETFYQTCLNDPHIYGLVVESGSDQAFCAGADVRGLLTMLPDNADDVLKYFHAEFQHNWTLQLYNKPNIPLIDGVVMGGGAGISVYGTHCIMGENAKFAMPEVNIGFIPDIGSSYYLSRLKGAMGLYLALTGMTIGAADCLYLGIATHTISSDKYSQIKDAMIDAQPIDQVLEKLQDDYGRSELAGLQEAVDRIFTGDSLEQVFKKLQDEADDGWSDHSDWARSTEELLRTKCPLSLKIAFKQFQMAAGYSSLKEALVTDMRIISRIISEPDFAEGIRAVLIDRTNDPKWKHAAVEDVKDVEVDEFFAPLETDYEFKDLKM